MERETKNLNEFYANRGLSVPQNGSSSRPITPSAKSETGIEQIFRCTKIYIIYLEADRFDNFDFVLEEATDDKPPDDGRTWFHPNDIRISLVLEPAQ